MSEDNERLYLYDNTELDWSDPEQAYEDDEFAVECLEHDLKYILKEHYLVARGTLGLWNGQAKGGQVIGEYHELAQLFQDYNQLFLEDGVMHLIATHHDGTNHIEFKLLNDKGTSYYFSHKDDMERSELIPKLFKAPYSKKITSDKKIKEYLGV